MFKKAIGVTLACVLLVACAFGQVKPEQKAAIRKIGVYSALGSTLNYDYIGTTIFTNRIASAKNDWQLDDHAAKTMVAALQAKNYQAHVLQPVVYSDNDISPEEFAVLQKLAKEAGDDAMVVITPAEQPSEQNQIHTRRGYGMVQRSMFGLTRTYLYNLMRVAVYNVASGKQLGWSKGYSAMTGAPPQKYLENWTWQDSFTGYTADQQVGLKADVELMTDPALAYAVTDMGL